MKMYNFRKKPVVIQAVVFDPLGVFPDGIDFDETSDRWIIDTLEGSHIVSPGDWVITGVKGEKYACKPDVFAMTYEPADEYAAEYFKHKG